MPTLQLTASVEPQTHERVCKTCREQPSPDTMLTPPPFKSTYRPGCSNPNNSCLKLLSGCGEKAGAVSMCLLPAVRVNYLQTMGIIVRVSNSMAAEIIANILPVAVIGLAMEIYYSPCFTEGISRQYT